MKIKLLVATIFLTVGGIAGCGGGGGSTPVVSGGGTTAQMVAVSGVVADGYLHGAEVFLDKNGTMQWDGTSPRTVSGTGGAYTLQMAPSDVGRYPLVVRAIPGSTIDEDNPGQAMTKGYVMTAPAGVTGFISPMSTLARTKMVFGGYTSRQRAMNEMRQQLNLNPGIDMMGDYMKRSPSDPQYQAMRDAARNLAGLMGNQMGMGTGATVNVDRFNTLMGKINKNLPQMRSDLMNGMGMQAFMQKYDFSAMLSSMPGNMSGNGFRNMSSLFHAPTGGVFWHMSSGMVKPGGGMMGSGTTTGGGMAGGGMM